MWRFHGRPCPIGYLTLRWCFSDCVLHFGRWFTLNRYTQIATVYQVYSFNFSFAQR